MALVTAASLYVINRDVKALVGAQQYVLITTVASALDQKFELRRTALQALADGLQAEDQTNGSALQAYVVRHRTLKSMFDNLSVFDAQGNLLANLNNPKLNGHFNGASRSYIQTTLATRRGVISEPLKGLLSKKPIVVMTAPVLDEKGDVRLIFVATIDLQQRNFLGQFANTRIGKTGYMFILSPDGTIIEHPNRSRILERNDTVGGRNLASEKALTGFEGTMEAKSRGGVPGIYSFKHMQSTQWIVGAAYPLQEALASVRQVEQQALLLVLLLAALAGAAAWFITNRQIAPLDHLKAAIEKLRAGEAHEANGRYREDEIGRLGSAFEALMEERQVIERALVENRALLQTVTDNMPTLIAYVDIDQRYKFANKTFQHWFGLAPEAMVGHSVREMLGEAAYTQLSPYLVRALNGERQTFEKAYPQAGGAVKYMNATYIPHLDENGTTLGVHVMVMDITERKNLELELHAQARHDDLTGLPNRAELNSRLQQAIDRAGRSQKSLALLFLDLDGFKLINDQYGHQAGDALLKEVARRLQRCVRKSDTVARLGGDEFTVIVESVDADQYGGEAVARKIIAEIAAPFDIGGGIETSVTTSVGVAYWREALSLEDLLVEADTAMYAAKAKGKNCHYVAPDVSGR